MTSSWRRRTFLHAAGSGALALGFAGRGGQPAVAAEIVDADAEFDALRAKWRDLILGTGFSPTAEPYKTVLANLGTTASGYRSTMAPTSGSLWPDRIWADPEPDTDGESYAFSANMNDSYNRLRTMAEAFAQPGTGLTGDTGLRDAVVTGLDHLCTEVFNEHTARYGNWWNFQIGAPQALMDICVLVHDALTDSQIANYCRAVDAFVPDSVFASYTGISTGANRVDLCRGVILRGIVGKDPDKVSLASEALKPVFPYVTSGDGFYADGSFIQHASVPYIGGYGSVLHDGVGRLLALLRGSAWELNDPNTQLFLDTIEKAVAPFVYNGLMMDNVSARGISRSGGNDHTRAHGLMATILLVGQGASEAENARWRAMVKGWMQRDYHSPALKNPGLGLLRTSLLQSLQDDISVNAAPEPVEHRLFHNMDRATHRRPGWCASVSMASRRVAHYEFGNGEHARGYHTGAGWLSWWGSDFGLEQYSDGYWPTVDPCRLPGITASRKPLADGAGGNWGDNRNEADWVGGTTDGEFAAVGQHLIDMSSTMNARKSWFFLDDSVVCLGADISSTDGHAVETTIDNRHLGTTGAPALTVDGRKQPTTQGWTRSFDDAEWAHIEGQAGYLFPGGAAFTAVREERTGAWKDINAGGPADPVTRRYLTLVTDHGTDPADAAYAYVLLPGASAATTARRACDRGRPKILANTADQQGVRVPRLGFTAVNFWSAGTLDKLTANAPASILIREKRDGTAVIVVSDPARRATSLEITWHERVSRVLSRPATVTSTTTGSSLKLTFGDLTGEAGAPRGSPSASAEPQRRNVPAPATDRPPGRGAHRVNETPAVTHPRAPHRRRAP
ncbi:polysaccharide lyase 8 family protein [Streptomyces formicae]|uniref:Polysaccharide lyase 8 family protein n=1 Tax=Streptomyces formicae TaxID=1616117 RepID=A0ABY3WJ16_9ACTN|nr:polysaccharide lyase 8 family protein [Streptomyces formicae]UNM12145.1 polysaccharide lyase 8 family protein [Streptomyces formicae]